VTHCESPGFIAAVGGPRARAPHRRRSASYELIRGNQLVHTHGVTPKALDTVERIEARLKSSLSMYNIHTFAASCKTRDEQHEAGFCSRHLYRSFAVKLAWHSVKGLYDDGFLARVGDLRRYARPVSPVAASVHASRNWLAVVRDTVRCRLDDSGRDRNVVLEFERQMHALLDPCNLEVQARSLSSNPSTTLRLRVDYMLPFSQLSETVNNSADAAVLFIPSTPYYPCDAIIVPSATSAGDPIIAIECTLSDPRDSVRAAKVRSWFEPDGWLSQLRAVHPTRDIIVLLCWSEYMSPSLASIYAELYSDAAAASVDDHSVTVRVLDLASLSRLFLMQCQQFK
jgi:hypothetical protein